MSWTSVTPEWGQIIDRDQDWKPYAQFPADKTDQNAILDLICRASSDWMSTYLDRPIAPTTFYERYDGWAGWSGSIILLPYYPVLEIIEIVEYWGANGPHVLVEQTPTYQWGAGYSAANPAAGTYQLNPRIGEIRRTFPGLIQRPFFPGSRNIEVQWVAGYSTIPAQLKIACLELATHWYHQTQDQANDKMGPSYGTDPSESNKYWPAVPDRVMTMLQPFKQQGIG